VTVPDLIGRPLEVARQIAQEIQLELVVGQERHDVEMPAEHVVDQAPPAGERVLQESEITVIASLGPEKVTMPNVVGFPLSVKRLDLEDLGLVVAVTDTLSSEPAGLIVRQEPTPGQEITAGSTVTLSISTGSYGLVEANFDDRLVLYAAELNATGWRPGDTIQVVITWHVLDRLPARYTTFIHITDDRGRIVAQLDRPPLGGNPPTDSWRAGEKFIDPYVLPLPSTVRPGTFTMRIGLYRGNTRLPIVDPGAAQAEGDALIVHEIVIKD
jgi:hypothetical protein